MSHCQGLRLTETLRGGFAACRKQSADDASRDRSQSIAQRATGTYHTIQPRLCTPCGLLSHCTHPCSRLGRHFLGMVSQALTVTAASVERQAPTRKKNTGQALLKRSRFVGTCQLIDWGQGQARREHGTTATPPQNRSECVSCKRRCVACAVQSNMKPRKSRERRSCRAQPSCCVKEYRSRCPR